MKNIKNIIFLIIITGFFSSLTAQELLSYEKIKSFTIAQIKAKYPVPAVYDVDVYKIIYTTKDVNMLPDTASGIICVALDSSSTFPVLLYDHGTVGNRHAVPSEGSGEDEFGIVFASLGYHCIEPDYIGLGVSKGIHPYIHPETEAGAGIDLMFAVKNLENTENIHFNDQIFITGYSQGGHASMATARELQNKYDMEVTAVAPMSGPYSVSKEMWDFTMGDEQYFFCAYIGSVLVSAKLAYPDLLDSIEIEDVMKPEYAEMIRKYENEELDLFVMNQQMDSKLLADEGKVLPKLMFKDSVRNIILSDEEHPLRKAIKRMDVDNWIPAMPLKMFYCKADDQVTYRNAVYTDSLMNSLGAENVSSLDVFSLANHGQCILPAIQNMLNFFQIYQQIGVWTATINPDDSEIYIYPNPAKDYIRISGNIQNEVNLEVINMQGEKLINKKINIKEKINISNLNQGIYFIKINCKGNITIRKMVKY